MKKILLAFTLVASLLACSSDSDNEETSITKSPITIEYLTKCMFWYYSPDGGLSKAQLADGAECYSFTRIVNVLSGAYQKDNSVEPKQYTYTVSAPNVMLTYKDGTKETLVVYRLDKPNDAGFSYLEINGKQFVGSMNGVDTETWKWK